MDHNVFLIHDKCIQLLKLKERLGRDGNGREKLNCSLEKNG